MSPFLEEVAKRILNEHKHELEQIYIVLPNRRAGLFLKKQMAKQMQMPFFSPKITSIEDFIVELTGIQVEDPVYLLFNLFQIHKELEGDRMLHFGEFAKFGEMLLHDFNDIDLHLADAKTIFTWLSEEKAISLWNVNGEELTPTQKSYLQFYSLLYTYYQKLNSFCEQRNKNYQGRIYRIAAENIDSLIGKINAVKIWIVGFNALTKSEYQILQYLERSGKAEIVWDADKYYMESDVQESGLFLRRYQSEFKNLNNFSDCFAEPKKIEVIGTSENVLQAKFVGQQIREYLAHAKPEETLENTAIVLADESLLLPVLNSLPSELNHVNVTMGYPFRLTPIQDLGDKLLQLHISSSKGSKKSYKREAVLHFLAHPYWQKTISLGNIKSTLLRKLSKINRLYISIDDIEQLCKESDVNFDAISFLFPSTLDSLGVFKMFDDLIDFFWIKTEEDLLEKEFIYTFYKLNNHLKEIQNLYTAFENLESLQIVYSTLANKISIPFYGEPLRGLQIMGLLETRVIDFENIILLSVNEGILPKGKASNSLLPFQIKKYFGIPSYNESDSIYAYHFYRLLQRANNITLLYNTDAEGFGKSEKSRYIKQLELELKQYSPKTTVVDKLLTATANPEIEKSTISVQKSQVVMDRLKTIANEWFSATSLNCYIRCSLQFYFTHILKIPETKELEETIDNAILGTVIHAVMENIFSPENYPNNQVTSAILETFKAKTHGLLVDAFEKEYPEGNLQTGKNKLIFEVAQKIIISFITKQQKIAETSKLEILGIEDELHSNLEIQTSEGKQTVKFYGKADRIDRLNNVLRIVDYKSGNVLDADLRIKSVDLEEFNLAKIPEKSFQLLLYSWLYNQEKGKLKGKVSSGIYSFRRIDDDLLTAKIDSREDFSEEDIQQFEVFLKTLLEELFNNQIPFSQTKDEKRCVYCPYTSMCGR